MPTPNLAVIELEQHHRYVKEIEKKYEDEKNEIALKHSEELVKKNNSIIFLSIVCGVLVFASISFGILNISSQNNKANATTNSSYSTSSQN